MILKFCLILGFFFGAIAQSCYPNYMVDQVVQNSVSLQFLPQERKTSESIKIYNHSFWGDAFASKPDVAYCLSEIEMTPIRQISYNFQTIVYTSAIEFQLYSKGIQWLLAKVHLWIFNRQDFFSKELQFSSVQGFTKKYSTETRINLPSFFITYKESYHMQPIYQTYLTGLQSVSSSLVSIHAVKLNAELVANGSVLKIDVSSDYENTIFSIRVLLVMVPIETTQFNSYEVDFTYKGFKSTYQLLNGRFHPIFNLLLGFKSIAFKTGQIFTLKQEYDMSKSLMKIFGNNGKTPKNEIQYLELSLLSFGRLMSQICAPCKDTFIEIDSCRKKCTDTFVPRLYYDSNGKQSGKICTKCYQQVNMEYSSDVKACICKKDHVMTDFGTRCNPKSNTIQQSQIKANNPESDAKNNMKQECPIQGTTFIDGKCQCQNNFELVNQKCMQKCQQNSKRDTKTGFCLCNDGYILNETSKKCEKKPQDKPAISQLSTVSQQLNLSNQSVSVPKQKLKITLDPKTPNYISSGIILDFFLTPVIKRTDEQIKKLFEITFSDNKLAPPQIFLTQNQNDIRQCRVFLFYRNSLPFKKFTVTIKVKDRNLGQDFITLLLDPLNVPAAYSRRSNFDYLNFGN